VWRLKIMDKKLFILAILGIVGIVAVSGCTSNNSTGNSTSTNLGPNSVAIENMALSIQLH
jgi:hypothetical protein